MFLLDFRDFIWFLLPSFEGSICLHADFFRRAGEVAPRAVEVHLQLAIHFLQQSLKQPESKQKGSSFWTTFTCWQMENKRGLTVIVTLSVEKQRWSKAFQETSHVQPMERERTLMPSSSPRASRHSWAPPRKSAPARLANECQRFGRLLFFVARLFEVSLSKLTYLQLLVTTTSFHIIQTLLQDLLGPHLPLGFFHRFYMSRVRRVEAPGEIQNGPSGFRAEQFAPLQGIQNGAGNLVGHRLKTTGRRRDQCLSPSYLRRYFVRTTNE